MTTKSADAPRDYGLGDIGEHPVVATDIIYEGSAVGNNGSGIARPLVALDAFLGFCLSKADNLVGSAGDKNVRVNARGEVELPITGVSDDGDVGKPVYASDDDTFTLTEGSNSYIGRIVRHVSGTTGLVAFNAYSPPGAELGALTDSSTGTAGATIADGTATYSQSITNDNNASIVARLNEIERMQRGI